MELIKASDLTKTYKTYQMESQNPSILSRMFTRKYEEITALDHVDLSIERGEMVGYVGINGAGKSTTIKLLTGILKPTMGEVTVFGQNPYKSRRLLAKRISAIFGQRIQLWWDLPVYRTYELLRNIYQIPASVYKENIDMFVELLDMQRIIGTPVRSLSLGQRMRAEFVAAFLHNPEIVYLDEPTIGLDVVAKEKIRVFLRKINKERQTTILLASHDLSDVEQTCQRLVLINQGQKIFDGQLDDIKKLYDKQRWVTLECNTTAIPEHHFKNVKLVQQDENKLKFSFRSDQISSMEMLTQLLAHYPVTDFHFEEPTLETIVRRIAEDGGVLSA